MEIIYFTVGEARRFPDGDYPCRGFNVVVLQQGSKPFVQGGLTVPKPTANVVNWRGKKEKPDNRKLLI